MPLSEAMMKTLTRFLMKSIGCGVAIALLFSFVPSAQAAPACVTTTLAALDNASCQIGDKLFNNFDYSTLVGSRHLQSTPQAPDPLHVGVTWGWDPATLMATVAFSFPPPGSPAEWGTASVIVNQTLVLNISYDVSVLEPCCTIDKVTFTSTGAWRSGVAGVTGQYARATKLLNNGDTAALINNHGSSVTTPLTLGSMTKNTGTGLGVTHVHVLDRVELDGGDNPLSNASPTMARAGMVQNQFTQLLDECDVPEPVTMLLLGSGLLLMGGIGRKRFMRQ